MRWITLLGFCATLAAAQEPPGPFTDYQMRGNLQRSARKFAAGGPARVAFMGGSVTTQPWREPVMAWLRQRFPNAQFDFVMAGVGGTDANLGAFRFPRDVWGRGPVDLFFLEFAVNGGGVRAMEGIVRQARRLNPELDIVLTYFANTSHTQAVNQNQVPGIVQEHERVADHYGLPSLFFYREVARRIQAGPLKWEEFSRDSVHPTALGCDLYAQWFIAFLTQAWADPAKEPVPVSDPEPLDPLCYQAGRLVAPSEAKVVSGFQMVSRWTTEKTANFRPPVDVLEATTAGAELTLDFTGTAVGLYLIAGFDAGTIEYAIDGGPAKTTDLFDSYCTRFHRPVHRVLADSLSPGAHRLVLKVTGAQHAQSTGHAVRLLQFLVNGQ